MRYGSLLVAAALILAVSTSAFSSSVIFDRGLPSANLNNAAGANRSNVSWAFADPQYLTGDDFSLPAGTWRIDSLTVWSPITAIGSNQTIGTWSPNGITLYGGNNGVSPLESSGAITGNAGANADVIFTPVNYPDGTTFYEGQPTQWQLWQVTFTNLNWVVQGGQLYQFGVNGPDAYWFNHASNAALSGTLQQGFDNQYLAFDMTNLAAGGTLLNSDGDGWDKSSDINVQITGEAVPEPLTMLAVIAGIGGIGAYIRKRRMAA